MEAPAHRRTRDYHRLILPGLVAVNAAAWGAVVAVDAANLPWHVWHTTLALAGFSTNALLISFVVIQIGKVNDRLDRGYRAMTAHRNGRPHDARTPAAWPVLTEVPQMRHAHGGNRR